MQSYNPNSVWTGKKEDPAYAPKLTAEFEKPKRAPEPAPHKSRTLLWAIITFAVLFAGGLVYAVFFRAPAGPNVSIGFPGELPQALTGDSFDFSVSLTNNSQTILRNATLSLVVPGTISFVGQSSGQRVTEQVIGDIGPGSINNQKFNLIVTGGPNSVQQITAKLIYSTDPSGKTQFETDATANLVVGGPAISLNIGAPQNIFSGQNFEITVNYNNNTSHNFQGVQLAMQYPPAFNFTQSSMPPVGAGNNTWNLGTVPAAGSGSFTIDGNVIGPTGASYVLDGTLSGSLSGSMYTLTDQTANLAIGSSPLSLSVKINNADNYVSHTGDSLNYVITYANNSNVTFQNAVIKAQFTGAMFDFTTLQSDGSLNSLNNTVTWYPANTPALLNIGPGQSGTVQVTMKTKTAFPIHLLSDRNYTLDVVANISSPTLPPGTVASSTISAATLENKIGGAVALAAKGFWHDAGSGILNSGPYPPKVNQATQYTIHWIITNYATDLSNVTVSANLQSGSTCTGQFKSNISTMPTCNSATGVVSWTIPYLAATTGITGPAAEAIIQITDTPAINQVGRSVTLLGPTALQATDAFTSSTLQATAGAVTTDLPDEKTVSTNGRQVTQ